MRIKKSKKEREREEERRKEKGEEGLFYFASLLKILSHVSRVFNPLILLINTKKRREKNSKQFNIKNNQKTTKK